MSQLLILAVLAIIGYVVWRRFAPPRGGDTKPVEKRDATTLERDPRTGVYHPSEHDRS